MRSFNVSRLLSSLVLPFPGKPRRTRTMQPDASLFDYFRTSQDVSTPPFAICPHLCTWVTCEMALDYVIGSGQNGENSDKDGTT